MKVTTIYGPPGTGKTRELIDIAHDRCTSQRGLFLSYTKAAALEAASRIRSDNVTASTLHSLAFKRLGLSRSAVVDMRKLAEFGAVAGIPFKGMDGADSEQEGDEYLSVYSYANNRIMTMPEAYDQFGRPGDPRRFEMFVISYERWKETYGYMDFDDMLVRASKLKFPLTPVILLDEAQDCSPLQWSVFEQVCVSAKEIYIAGDDDQAIYEWGGADPHGMIKFTAANSGAERTLKQSYRLPRSVFAHATKLLGQVTHRVDKTWIPASRDGSVGRVGNFEVHMPMDPDWNTLILVRDNFRLREVQQELHAARVPYAMSTSNSPYEGRVAKAIRAWHREGPPEEDEREAIMAIGTPLGSKFAAERNWKLYRAQGWEKMINVPVRQRDFYYDLDARLLFVPLRIRLSTIHQAKGMEADLVLLDLAMTQRVEAGIDLNRDAEARVWYVGMTRARHELQLSGENPIL